MKFRKLNFQTGGFIAAVLMTITAVACNNSDKSAKNSTTGENNMADTTTNAKNSTPVKKTGKASVTIVAEDKSGKIEVDKMGYYNRTEVLPVYPGGQHALETYVNNNIEYPEEAINNNIEGIVNIQFAIDDQGNVSNAKAVGNKIGYGLEEAAVKVVSGMPKWTPGMVKGMKVKAWYTLPITYRLE